MKNNETPSKSGWSSRFLLIAISVSLLLGGLFSYFQPSPNQWIFYSCFIASGIYLLAAIFAPARIRALMIFGL